MLAWHPPPTHIHQSFAVRGLSLSFSATLTCFWSSSAMLAEPPAIPDPSPAPGPRCRTVRLDALALAAVARAGAMVAEGS